MKFYQLKNRFIIKHRRGEMLSPKLQRGLTLLLSCLVFIFSSCTIEEIDTHGKPFMGKKVAVHFTMEGRKYHGHEIVTRTSPPAPLQERGEDCHSECSEAESKNLRSFDFAQDDISTSLSAGPAKDDISTSLGMTESVYSENFDSETVIVPVGDGLAMVATLEIDQSVKTRIMTSGIDTGTKIRIVAYAHGNVYQDHADFTVASDHTLVSLNGNPFEVPVGNYKFVAYAYHKNTLALPAHIETIPDIDPLNDLIWGCFPTDGTTVTVDEHSHNNISIMMYHKFSGVTVHLSTNQIGSPGITHIDKLSISGTKADLNVVDGSLPSSANNVRDYYSGSYTNLGTAEVSTSGSTPIMVYTGGAQSTILQIDTLVLNGNKKIIELEAVFSKQLQSGYLYTLKVTFQKDAGITGDDHVALDNHMTMYVGSFWKKNQTGERLIRMKRPTSGIIDGPWTAKVIVGGSWIVLDTQMTTDPNVSWITNNTATEQYIHNGNDPNFDALHPVNSTQTSVSGTLNASNPWVYFRIGLRSQYQPTPGHPVRYGAVLVTYNNGMKHRIWIRQGEDADYLISNEDPPFPVSGKPNMPRTVTKRFVPYNLSADTLDRPVVKQADYYNQSVIGNRSRFTDYPTQTGAHFQWAVISNHPYSRARYAWNPYVLTIPSATVWWGTTPPNDLTADGYWINLKAENETCPPGYRRPNDGAIDKAEPSTNIQFSELRQSLLEQPKTGLSYNEDMSNSVYGYYADGFFDRRLIVVGTSSRPNRLTTVAMNTRDIAHAGRLFYNAFANLDHANASLFFPYGGTRYYDAGSLSTTLGNQTFYWTSSRTNILPNNNPPQNLYAHIFRFNDDGYAIHPGPESACGTYGSLIRCVVDE